MKEHLMILRYDPMLIEPIGMRYFKDRKEAIDYMSWLTALKREDIKLGVRYKDNVLKREYTLVSTDKGW